MTLVDTILTVLCLLGALQGLLLGVALATLDLGPRRADRLLSLILVSSSVVLVIVLLSHRAGARLAAGLELAEYSMWFFAGPVAYLYVALVTTAGRLRPTRVLLHLAPGLAWLGYLALHAAAPGGGAPWLPPVGSLMLYQMAYTALAARCWWGSAKRPASAGIHALWVPTLLVVLVVQHAAQLVRWTWSTVAALRDVVPLAGAASFVVITFLGLRRALPNLGRARRRYSGSTLTAERAAAAAERLTRLLESERPYLRPDLTLDQLAELVEVPRTHLSQVVNQRFGQSVPDLLSRYRLAESERLLRDDAVAHLTIDAIARRSGFQSRSAFYEAFRRRHEITPSEFRRRARAS